jgi:hypothetical protein
MQPGAAPALPTCIHQTDYAHEGWGILHMLYTALGTDPAIIQAPASTLPCLLRSHIDHHVNLGFFLLGLAEAVGTHF